MNLHRTIHSSSAACVLFWKRQLWCSVEWSILLSSCYVLLLQRYNNVLHTHALTPIGFLTILYSNSIYWIILNPLFLMNSCPWSQALPHICFPHIYCWKHTLTIRTKYAHGHFILLSLICIPPMGWPILDTQIVVRLDELIMNQEKQLSSVTAGMLIVWFLNVSTCYYDFSIWLSHFCVLLLVNVSGY